MGISGGWASVCFINARLLCATLSLVTSFPTMRGKKATGHLVFAVFYQLNGEKYHIEENQRWALLICLAFIKIRLFNPILSDSLGQASTCYIERRNTKIFLVYDIFSYLFRDNLKIKDIPHPLSPSRNMGTV